MALFSNNNGIFSPSGKQIIPSVTSADAGKVLSVDDNGAWGAATAPDPLPEVTSADAGKVLTVSDAGAWEAAAASGGGLPAVTEEDAYKTLLVSEDGEWVPDWLEIEGVPPVSGNINGFVLTAKVNESGSNSYDWQQLLIPTVYFNFSDTNNTITPLYGVTVDSVREMISKHGIALAVFNPNGATAYKSSHLMYLDAHGIRFVNVKSEGVIDGVNCMLDFDIIGAKNKSGNDEWTVTYKAYKIEASGPSA